VAGVGLNFVDLIILRKSTFNILFEFAVIVTIQQDASIFKIFHLAYFRQSFNWISIVHQICPSPANSSNAVARNQMLEINCSKMKLLDCNFSRNTSSSNCNFSKMFCSNLYGRKCVIGV
jgi:hypothetical protein